MRIAAVEGQRALPHKGNAIVAGMAAISVAPLSPLPLLKDLPALLADLTHLVTAIGLLCGDMFFPRERVFLQWLTVVGAITALAAIVAVSAGGGVAVFDGMCRADGFGALLKAVCVMALAFTALMSENFYSHAQMRQGEYCCLAVCSTLGMCVMASAGDLIVLYLALSLWLCPYTRWQPCAPAIRAAANRLCCFLACPCCMGLPGTPSWRG